jgi:hypothetical protein
VAGRSDSRTEDATGRSDHQASETFLQRYSLDLAWRLYPNLQVLAGGLFERDSANGEEGAPDTTQRRIRPYFNAVLRTAISSATLGYYRNEDDLKTDSFSTRNIQEIMNARVGWNPEHRPSLTFRFIRTNDFDAERLTQDTTDDLADVVSEYAPAPEVQLYYRGALEEFEDRLDDLHVRRLSQAGRVNYGDAWWDQRIQLAAEYDVNYRNATVRPGGTGEFSSPLFPIAGLFSITDTPEDGTLPSDPALIDGDRTAPAGINLGLPPVGGDERPRNLGLDLGAAIPVNAILVWVDRPLPADIANSFSWDVYTSADNLTWVLERTVFPAAFGPFETRFEIRFPELTARYVKVVTRPLARSVPTADRFPNILVTELAAELRTPASETELRSRQTLQFLTTSLRARMVDRPLIYYEFSCSARDSGAAPPTYTLSNGFSLLHVFNPVYSVSGRVAREDSRETQGDRLSYLYSAALRAVPFPTLQSSLVFSGRNSEIGGLRSDSSSVFLYTTAELYRGVNAILGFGQSIVNAETGEQTHSNQINAQATLVPHPTMMLNLLYQSTDARREGGVAPQRNLDRRASQASVTYRPVPTLYFFFSYRLEDTGGTGNRFLRDSSVSWSPFPDGRLQLILSYDDTYRSDLEALTRVFSPRVRWNVTDRSYLEVAYQSATFDSTLEKTDSANLTAGLRIWF